MRWFFFSWSLSVSKSSQVSRTLLSILADLNKPVVWMVSTRPLISKSSSHCTSLLVTVPSASITIGITITFVFHRFFCSLARSKYSISFLQFYPLISQNGNFFFCWQYLVWSSGWDSEIHLYLAFRRILCVLFSRTDYVSCMYHLSVRSNFKLLHNSLLITVLTDSYVDL